MANNMAATITCPFCGVSGKREYKIQLHIEEHHTEDSPFVPQHAHPSSTGSSSASASRDSVAPSSHSSPASMPDTWTRCTRPNCGTWVVLSDIDEHLDLHAAIALADEENETPPPLPPRRRSRSPVRESKDVRSAKRSSRHVRPNAEKRDTSSKSDGKAGTSLLNWLAGVSYHGRSPLSTTSNLQRLREPQNPGRLGKTELGPYAFEQRMPESVRKHLLQDAEPQEVQRIRMNGGLIRETIVPNETPGLIPVLADLCALDEDTATTYLCHPSVRHIHKINCDGNFCGFWNIQVLLTYIQYMNPHGPQRLPNVLKIQSLIERAWDNGICAYSRVETGGIKDTRKWIGTQEALAFFTHIGVNVEPLSVVDGEEGSGKFAVQDLLDFVEAYFMSGTESASIHGTSFTTQLAPIYFQRFGHSMAIVGLERREDGSRNLLIFDSSFATSEAMSRLLAGRRAMSSISNILKPYRRTEVSLSRWDEFELIVPHTNKT